MENFNSEYAQMYESSSGIFNQCKESVFDFKQIGQTPDFPELDDITNLTKFDENLSNLSVIDAIETPINEEEESNESFETTLSANEFDDDLDIEIDVEDLEHIIEDTINEFPNLLDEITDDDLNAVEMLNEQIVPQFQLPVINQIEDIKPEIHYQELRHQEPVIIPIMNDKMEVIREEFQCTICQKNFTALSSLTRHTKTQKHQRMLSHQQVDQIVPNLSFNSVPTQNFSYYQQLMMPSVNYVQCQPEVQFQRPSTPKIEQKRQNFTQRIQNSRNNMIDQNRMIAIKEEPNNDNIMIIEDINEPKVEEKVQILEDLVNSGFEGSFVDSNQPIQAPEPKTTTQNATKSAIQNSMKILSKINTETALKSPEPILKTESSPKKQNLKQLTLMDMTFKKPAAIQQNIEDEVEVKEELPEFPAVTENLFDFDFNADDFLDSFNQEQELPKIDPEPELAQYIQEVPEELNSEQQDEQPQFQFVISGDEVFTITQIKVPEQPKQSNLQKILSKKRLERIQNDISTSYEAYKCNFCSKAFSTQSNLRRHEHLHGSKKLHQCSLCGKEFMQKEYLKKHMMTH